jgi:hypothetical protein
MIYLSPKVRSGYNEETFWVWFERNFQNSSYTLPKTYNEDDTILRYSTMGPININPGKTIALCWELLPEMKIVLNQNTWDGLINLTYKTAQSADRIAITSEFSRKYYEPYGKVDILPIGVNTDLFKPFSDEKKNELKLKYNVPLDKEIGFWCGTTHPMKGFQYVQKYANENPDIYWIIVWYQQIGNFVGNGQQHKLVNQNTMSELMNCADFQLSASILRPYYIIEYEGMACNLPQRKIFEIEKDFEAGENPRDVIFEKKWDRRTCKISWEDYIKNA